jgi:hypothetical protein
MAVDSFSFDHDEDRGGHCVIIVKDHSDGASIFNKAYSAMLNKQRSAARLSNGLNTGNTTISFSLASGYSSEVLRSPFVGLGLGLGSVL